MRKLYAVAFLLLITLTALSASSSATTTPTIFFTDLQSGPATGNSDTTFSTGGGAYVTLYGNNFGATQGTSTVTLNGASCLTVVSWSTSHLWYQQMTVQIGPTCTSGTFVVTVGGQASNCIDNSVTPNVNNACHFTVRTGNIRYVKTTGSNGNPGTFSSPWQTLIKYAAMSPGDIIYAGSGTVAQGEDNFGGVLDISGFTGTAANPYAIVAYPGATPVLLVNGTATRCLRNFPSASNYWIFAGITMQLPNGSECIYLGSVNNWRFVANDVTCPTGAGATACMTTAGDSVPFTDVLGNTLHDIGCPGSMSGSFAGCGDTQKTYHAFYWGDLSGGFNHDIIVGWNDVHNVYGCRGIMFHSKDNVAGNEGFSLTVHDNLVYNVRCDGINFVNVNPDKGPIVAYNNVLFHTGCGPDPSGAGANYTCINTGDINGSPVTPAEIYNNTCYDGGARGAAQGDAGAFSASIPTRYRNNNVVELSGEAYLTTTTTAHFLADISGSNNIWSGVSGTPSQTTGNVTTNPGFVDTTSCASGTNAACNLRLSLVTSSANGAGETVLFPTYDDDGLVRPNPPAIGSFEFAAGSSTTSVVVRPQGAVRVFGNVVLSK